MRLLLLSKCSSRLSTAWFTYSRISHVLPLVVIKFSLLSEFVTHVISLERHRREMFTPFVSNLMQRLLSKFQRWGGASSDIDDNCRFEEKTSPTAAAAASGGSLCKDSNYIDACPDDTSSTTSADVYNVFGQVYHLLVSRILLRVTIDGSMYMQ